MGVIQQGLELGLSILERRVPRVRWPDQHLHEMTIPCRFTHHLALPGHADLAEGIEGPTRREGTVKYAGCSLPNIRPGKTSLLDGVAIGAESAPELLHYGFRLRLKTHYPFGPKQHTGIPTLERLKPVPLLLS